jgi:hypothetical protein
MVAELCVTWHEIFNTYNMKTIQFLLAALLFGLIISLGNINKASAQDTAKTVSTVPAVPVAPPQPVRPPGDNPQVNGTQVLNNGQESVNNGQAAITGIPINMGTKKTKVKKKESKKDNVQREANIRDSLPPQKAMIRNDDR